MESCPTQELDNHAFMQVNGAMSNPGVRQACIYAGKWSHVQLETRVLHEIVIRPLLNHSRCYMYIYIYIYIYQRCCMDCRNVIDGLHWHQLPINTDAPLPSNHLINIFQITQNSSTCQIQHV